MEATVLLAFLKLGWDIAQEIRGWVKEAEAHPGLKTGLAKHGYVAKKAGTKIRELVPQALPQDIDAVVNLKIKDVVGGLKGSGNLGGV